MKKKKKNEEPWNPYENLVPKNSIQLKYGDIVQRGDIEIRPGRHPKRVGDKVFDNEWIFRPPTPFTDDIK